MFTLDLAFPGVRLSTVLVCVLVVDLLTQIFDRTMEVMCGAMLATFGRVSVLARMKEVGAILRLTTIHERQWRCRLCHAFHWRTSGTRFPCLVSGEVQRGQQCRCCGPWPVFGIGSRASVCDDHHYSARLILSLHSNSRVHFGHSLARLVVVVPPAFQPQLLLELFARGQCHSMGLDRAHGEHVHILPLESHHGGLLDVPGYLVHRSLGPHPHSHGQLGLCSRLPSLAEPQGSGLPPVLFSRGRQA